MIRIPGFRIPERGRTVTDEPQAIAPHLMGAPLASFRRRMVAYLVDLILFGIVVGALFLGVSAFDLHRQDPTFYSLIQERRAATDSTTAARLTDELTMSFLVLVHERCPDALPGDVVAFVEARDLAAMERDFSDDDLMVAFDGGRTRMTGSQPRNLILGKDFLFGPMSTFMSWGAFFVGWFTLWIRLTRGRSPGKFLFRMRVVRLDGKKPGWWDAFSRAGGYSASTATLLLGFLEAIWHPNRQAIHDKIAGTVVVKTR